MEKHRLVLIFLLISRLTPQNANEVPYKWPLGIFNGYSSAFQEFRSNHFHAGLDLRTFQKTGYPVYAIADGRITKIRRVKHGSGNGLYLSHDDGNTSIYFHLDKFTPEIEKIADRVREARGKKYFGNYVLKKPLRVKAGEIIAYSGETGYGFPHLHLEVRDKNYQALNPFKLLKFPSRDAHFPVLKCLIFRNKSPALINGKLGEYQLTFVRENPSLYRVKKPVVTSGKFDLILNARDVSDSGKFVAPYEISFFIDGVKLYNLKFDRFVWEDNNQLGFVYDMDYSLPGNFFFNIFSQSGFELEEKKTDLDGVFDNLTCGEHECQLLVKDNFGNVSTGIFTLCKVEKPVMELSNVAREPERITMDILNLSAPSADKIGIRLLDDNLHSLYIGDLSQTSVRENRKLVLESITDGVRWLEFSFIKHGIGYEIKKMLLNEENLGAAPGIEMSTLINRDLVFLKIKRDPPPSAAMTLEVVQGGRSQSVRAFEGKDFLFFCFRPSGIDNDIELKFSDNKNRGVPPVESKKIRIVHLISGIEQTFSDGEFEATFSSGTVREPKVLLLENRHFASPYPVESRQISLAPYHFPFLDVVFYAFKKDLPEPRQMGIFRYDQSRKRWKYVYTIYERTNHIFKTRLISSGTFALMRDVFPPVIRLVKPGSMLRARIAKITIRVTDRGKGIDDSSLYIWINQNKVLDCEYDPDWHHVEIEDLRYLKAGANLLKVEVKDHGGNRSSRVFRLFLK